MPNSPPACLSSPPRRRHHARRGHANGARQVDLPGYRRPPSCRRTMRPTQAAGLVSTSWASPPVPLSPAAEAKARAWRRTATRSTAGWCACAARRRRSRCGGRATARRRRGAVRLVASDVGPEPDAATAELGTGAGEDGRVEAAGRAEVLQLCDWVQRELFSSRMTATSSPSLRCGTRRWSRRAQAAPTAPSAASCSSSCASSTSGDRAPSRAARAPTSSTGARRSTRRSNKSCSKRSSRDRRSRAPHAAASPAAAARPSRCPTATAAAAAPWTSGSAAATARAGGDRR